jgi:hypothetical protein
MWELDLMAWILTVGIIKLIDGWNIDYKINWWLKYCWILIGMLKWIKISMVEFVICGVNIYKWINYVYTMIKQDIEFIPLGCVGNTTRREILWQEMCTRCLR